MHERRGVVSPWWDWSRRPTSILTHLGLRAGPLQAMGRESSALRSPQSRGTPGQTRLDRDSQILSLWAPSWVVSHLRLAARLPSLQGELTQTPVGPRERGGGVPESWNLRDSWY